MYYIYIPREKLLYGGMKIKVAKKNHRPIFLNNNRFDVIGTFGRSQQLLSSASYF